MTTPIELVVVDADDVIIDTNIREERDLTEEFVGTVRKYGVQTPVLGYLDAEGVVHIRMGQRRTLAARETKQPLPVVLAPREDSEIARITEQLIENEARVALRPSDRVKAWKQLELEGLSVTKIAGALGEQKDVVKAALAIASDSRSLTVADEHNVDLLHLAAALEFADDPALHGELMEIAIAEPTQFEHQLQLARNEREMRANIAARESEIEAEGRVVFRRADFPEGNFERLSAVIRRDDLEATAEGEPDIRVAVSVNYYGELREEDMIINPAAYGFASRYSSSSSGPMTDEQKAERKVLIRRNKQWDAAASVRARWLEAFLGRKQFPKDCGAFVSITLARHGHDIGTRGQSLSAKLLGLDGSYTGPGKSVLADLVESQPTKAGLVALAIVLGQLEDGTSRDTWRYPSAEGKHYLLALEGWGYALSPVEKIAAGYEVADDEVQEADDLDEFENELDGDDDGERDAD